MSARQLAYDAWFPKPGGGRATITQLTETFENRNGRRVPKSRRLRVSRVGDEVAAVPSGERVPTADPPTPTDSAAPVIPAGLTFEARPRGVATTGAWRERHPLAGVAGVEVETEGVGDGPASAMRFYENGRLAKTVTQSYRRNGTLWELMRRETTTADGRLRDLVTVERAEPAAAAIIPFVGGGGMARGTGAPEVVASAEFDEDCDPCKALREARNAAYESLMWQEAAALLVCALTPPPADLLACSLAGLKVAEAWSKFTRADNAYDACAANPPPCTPPPAPPAPPSGGGRPGGNNGGTTTCYYRIWYEVNTGRVIHSELLYCVSEEG